MHRLFIAVAAALASLGACAETQIVILELPTMNCAVCPITVKKALDRVGGVSEAEVSFETKRARVTYDDAEIGVAALIEATTNAGYPSTVAAEVAE